MDIRQLRYFQEIVAQGSLTRAAESLHVAQPALSLHLKNMEEQLGTRLLTRSRSGVTPTEAGELLLQRARAILEDLARTEDDIRNLETDPSGIVRIGLPGTISAMVSLPLILAARERFPRITLNITEAMSGFVGDWLSEGKIDLAVLYSRSKDARIRSELLLEEELVVLWPADAERPLEMNMEALDKVPMVLPSGAHGLRVLIDRTFQAQGFAPEIAMEIDSFNNIKRLVAAGFGPSILPLYAVTEEVAAGSLRVSRIAAPGLWRGAHLMSPGGRPVTRALEAVHALLREVILDLRDKGAWAASRPPQVSGTAQVS
ncbi:HTH-type transcriptional regulator GltC [Labrenzia sp. THAF191b]|uniref:LysR family transcriptional regulator n=1 Tax=unclassified Labrenzia TaxID=2648686 RepID=UPI0012693E1C|nr:MULTISPECIES: LysR family transcriptional regulator [unclassified Labrenzia]QFS99056.1 HTH-type transcriptional regulator GltC [Labrenzia sp. THAF191b]QFT05370.1 HTH-type transcriptional regulator GltC [Labrenzia sp. THAF191a]QFT16914.1 HTH-type transcriptional regulator GltC [Labrenzia sp. THAF187b]